MNSPADTLAALAAAVAHQVNALRALAAEMRNRGTCAPGAIAQVADYLAAALARASLKGEAEPVAWCQLTPNGGIAYFDGKPMVMVGQVGNYLHPTPLYTAPPPQQAVERSFSAYGYSDEDRARILSALQSARDRMARVLPKSYGEGFDGDLDTMLEAINYMKRCRQQAPTPSPAPQGGGEAAHWKSITDRLKEEVDGYEFRGDEGDYTPNERERMLLLDFAMGLPDELFATPPAQQPGEVVTDEMVEAASLAWMRSEFTNIPGDHDELDELVRLLLTAALAPKEKGNGPALD